MAEDVGTSTRLAYNDEKPVNLNSILKRLPLNRDDPNPSGAYRLVRKTFQP